MKSHPNHEELVTLLWLPDDDPEIGGHVSACAGCSARLERLRAAVDESASSVEREVERLPETFWRRQHIAISRRLQGRRVRRPASPAISPSALRGLAAMLLIAVAGHLWFDRQAGETNSRPDSPQVAVRSAQPAGSAVPLPERVAPFDAVTPSNDAWSSEPLEPFGELVAWESWLNEPVEGI